MEMYPGIRKMFKSAKGLDPDHFLVIFRHLERWPHCENTKFYDSQAKKELKKIYPERKIRMENKTWCNISMIYNNNDFMVVSYTKVLSLYMSYG